MSAKALTPLLQVYDMKTSVAFYRDKLGFHVANTYEPDDHLYWASLEMGNIKLMLNACYEDNARPSQPEANRINAHKDTELYLECENIDEVYKSLIKNGLDIKPPSQTVYGAQEIRFKDPDGFYIIFFQENA